MKIIHFSEINKAVEENPGELVLRCDADFEKQCREIAEHIADCQSEHPIILLAGPSGSGKTTTALKIEEYLDGMGLQTHTISMDNYFLSHDKVQVFDENNEIDYESPYRIDIPLLQEHMMKLANCEEVDIPAFHFPTQTRVEGRKLRRKKGELILFEGIHALNPEVTGYEDIASCLYVSVRTRIQLSNGELAHPEYIRLMRRIIRDRNFRNRRPTDTLDMFDSVQRGENLYINPYKHRAHWELDTFMEYEASLYSNYIKDDFLALKDSYSAYSRYIPVEYLLGDLIPLDPSAVSDCSLVREFIGGSKYHY